MSLSFKLPRRVVSVSDRPFGKRKQVDSEPVAEVPAAPAYNGGETGADELTEILEAPNQILLTEEELQERIQREAQKLAETLAEQRAQPLREMLRAAMAEMEKQKQDLLERVEEAAVKLAREMARKIIRKELETSPEVILHTVREAMRRVASAERITIRCHPEDAALLRQNDEFQGWLERQQATAKIIEDENIERGGCFIESERGEIDATIATQIRELEHQLFGQENQSTGDV